VAGKRGFGSLESLGFGAAHAEGHPDEVRVVAELVNVRLKRLSARKVELCDPGGLMKRETCLSDRIDGKSVAVELFS